MAGSDRRLLLVSQPSPAGVAFLAESILDAERSGVEPLWLCHPEWSSVRSFWTRTLRVLRENPGGLPLRSGRTAQRAQFPASWSGVGWSLVILGLPYLRPAPHESLRDSRRRCQADLEDLAGCGYRIVHLHRHAGDGAPRSSHPRVLHVSLGCQRACHLDVAREGPLARLGAVANLAREERRCSQRTLRRARGLIARLTGSDYAARLEEVLPRLCVLDAGFLEAAPLPDLQRPQESMVVLRHTVVLDLDGVPSGFGRHALEEALQLTGRTYAVGLQTRRDGSCLQVARRWRGRLELPSAHSRLSSVADKPGWAHATRDHLFSASIPEEELFLDLLDEVLTTLEGEGGSLPRGGEAVLSWRGGEIHLGRAGAATCRLALSEAPTPRSFRNSDEEGASWDVRGELTSPDHPLRRVLSCRLRPVPDHERLRGILSAYRRLLFRQEERGLVHRLRGRLATGVGALAAEEGLPVRQRVQDFLRETLWPWPEGLIGGSSEAAERRCLEALAQGAGDDEALLWLLDTMGDRPDEVGAMPETVLDHALTPILDPRPAPGVIWPTTHLELVLLGLQNATEHGGPGPFPPLLVVSSTPEGPEVRLRDYGSGPRVAVRSLLETSQERGGGGVFQWARELERMHAVGWLKGTGDGCLCNGLAAAPLRRRWLLVGEIAARGALPEWLELVRVPTPSAATRMAEHQEPGAFDGMVLGHGVASSEFDNLAASRKAWRWFTLPRLELDAARPGEPWQERLARMPGMEVGWRLSPFR